MAYNNRNRSLLSLLHHTDRDLHYLLDLARDLKRAKYSGAVRNSLHRDGVSLRHRKLRHDWMIWNGLVQGNTN